MLFRFCCRRHKNAAAWLPIAIGTPAAEYKREELLSQVMSQHIKYVKTIFIKSRGRKNIIFRVSTDTGFNGIAMPVLAVFY